MNQNVEVLNAVYQNAQMAIDSIETLSKKVTDSNFRNDLHEQRKRYSEFANLAVEELEKYGARADDISAMSKLGLNAGINMNMMMNNHTGHLAEMMIQGTNMGVIELKKCRICMSLNAEISTVLKIICKSSKNKQYFLTLLLVFLCYAKYSIVNFVKNVLYKIRFILYQCVDIIVFHIWRDIFGY